jgi:hypothetical protein
MVGEAGAMSRTMPRPPFDFPAIPGGLSALRRSADFQALLRRIAQLGELQPEPRRVSQHMRAYCRTVSVIACQERFRLGLMQSFAFADHYTHGFLNGLYGVNVTSLKGSGDCSVIPPHVLEAAVELGRRHATTVRDLYAATDEARDSLESRQDSADCQLPACHPIWLRLAGTAGLHEQSPAVSPDAATDNPVGQS